ncbi:MAG: endopeptidase La [candidate division WOR-3 bacterium]
MPEEKTLSVPEILPVLAIKGGVVFPHLFSPILIATKRSRELVDDVLAQEGEPKFLAAVTQKPDTPEDAKPQDLYEIGCAAIILKMSRSPDGNAMRLLLSGVERIRIREIIKEDPYLVARVELLREPEVDPDDMEARALKRGITEALLEIAKDSPNLAEEQVTMAAGIEDLGRFGDIAATLVNLSVEDKQRVLETIDPIERLKLLLPLLDKEAEIIRLSQKIRDNVKEEIDKGQREYFLREQLKAIQKELGIGEGREIAELREKMEKAGLPEKARAAAERELARLETIPSVSPEYTVSRNYLEWLITLPWNQRTEDNLDMNHARRVLDEDHYDLERVKRRILEFLAVRSLRKDAKGSILCFVGPPGVGKTSLGKSIARAMGRKFIRVSLGGMRDEAEIRGHRRTYVGAIPGRIISAIRDAGTKNPVFMMDEIDKLGSDFRGDPASALLEVLDPEQNHEFSDHYLEVPFDLSEVFFITTANTIATIPPPLLDRMETIEIEGYIEEDKLRIAQDYLIRRETEATGLSDYSVIFSEKILRKIIRDYTRESGVRELSRRINAVLRRVAVDVSSGKMKNHRIKITERRLREYLGPPVYYSEMSEMAGKPGVATGLVWTPFGGDVVFIESEKVPGGKRLMITGQLGEVMRESCEIALTLVRARAKKLGITEDFYDKNDVHIHVPSGAVPKDGPSAGITIFTSLVSLFTERPLDPTVAMTGEITLAGKVLPVGGIKEKVVAAARVGVKKILLPRWNLARDLEEIPEHIRRKLEFVPLDEVDDALGHVFPGAGDGG